MDASWHEQPTTQLPVLTPAPARSRLLPWLAGISVLLVAMVSLAVAGYVAFYADRVLPGVRVAGADLGGLSEAEAVARLTARLEGFAGTPLTLVAGERSWQVPARDLGVHYDVKATVDAAMAVGRQGPPSQRLRAWWPLGTPTAVQPVGQLDQTKLLTGLKPVTSALNQPPVDATALISPEAGLTVTPAQPGQQLDLAAVTLTLRERALLLSDQPVPLVVQPLAPVLTERDLAPVNEAAADLLRQPLTLELSQADAARLQPATTARRWTISPRDLMTMLAFGDAERRTLALDPSRLSHHLASMAAAVERDSQDADLALSADGQVVLTPHVEGIAVDVPATVEAVNQAIARREYTATLVTRIEQPAVLTADLEPVRAQADRLLERSLAVSAADLGRTLGRKELASLLVIEPRPAGPVKAVVAADPAAVTDYVASLGRVVKREARPPVFKYREGQVVQTAEAVQGRQLDESAAVPLLTAAMLDPTARRLSLPVTLVDAPLATVNPAEIAFPDVLAVGTTYYGFSLPERKHNVELATQRLNGTLIAPGEMFSFNRAVGRVSIASGYQTGYGIVLTNGAVQTVPSVGGGICQVATTVFHAAFRAGFPIGERNWHFYWIPTYGEPPSGMTGLDATVDEDYGLDFTFKNTTGNWVALETSYDGQHITMTLKGTNPGWQVQVGGPTISNVKKADPSPVTRPDPTLPAGRRVQVETARDGMDVSITRAVYLNGQLVDQRTFNSHYEPSQNVTLVGTGG